jgi:Rrf2 family protein
VPGFANTQFALAVHVLVLLAIKPETMQTSEDLAAASGASAVHVRRVLGGLRSTGLVESRPGPHGGWRVPASTCGATLASIWSAVRADEPLLGLRSGAADADDRCPHIQDALQAVDRRAVAAVTAELEQITLHDLVVGAVADPSWAATCAVAGTGR